MTYQETEAFQKKDSEDYSEIIIPTRLDVNEISNDQIVIELFPVKDAKNLLIYTYVKSDMTHDIVENYCTSYSEFAHKSADTFLLVLKENGYERKSQSELKQFLLDHPDLIK